MLTPSKRPQLLLDCRRRGPRPMPDGKLVTKREWRKKRTEAGLCHNCPRKLDREGVLCTFCAGKLLGNYKKRREKFTALGICCVCTKEKVSENGDFRCPPCRTAYAIHQRERTQKLKDQVFAAYGNKCACCGETIKLFLTLDHPNGDGAEQRKELFGKNTVQSTTMYRWIIRNGYPNTLRLYCWNCNVGAYHNGGVCPHVA